MIRIRRPRRQHYHFLRTATRAGSHCSTSAGGPPQDNLLDVSVILSPGKFCKAPNATILDASRRLVNGRRKFVRSLQNDLWASSSMKTTSGSCSSSGGASDCTNSTRKIYSLVGHGVPIGLLHQLCDAAKGWLGMRQRTKATSHNNKNDDDDAQQQDQPQQYDQISFTNIPNTTLLDTKRIYCTICSNQRRSNDNVDDTNEDDHPTTKSSSTITTSQEMITLSSLPKEWDYNIEMYMVVMDRIASRMAYIASMAHPPPRSHRSSSSRSTSNKESSDWRDELRESTIDDSIIVTPSQLQQYNVTITRASSTTLPNNNAITSLLSDEIHTSSLNTTTPTKTTAIARGSVGNDRRKQRRGRSLDNNSDTDDVDVNLPPPTLTLEYVHKSNSQTMSDDDANDDCCEKVILILHDHRPTGKCIHQATTTSVSLIFEGEYALPL